LVDRIEAHSGCPCGFPAGRSLVHRRCPIGQHGHPAGRAYRAGRYPEWCRYCGGFARCAI